MEDDNILEYFNVLCIKCAAKMIATLTYIATKPLFLKFQLVTGIQNAKSYMFLLHMEVSETESKKEKNKTTARQGYNETGRLLGASMVRRLVNLHSKSTSKINMESSLFNNEHARRTRR